MFCDICKQAEATIHTTQTAGSEVQGHLNLCRECFEASKPADSRELATALQAGCRYCGGEPYIGGADPVTRIYGIRKSSFMCKLCAEEYYNFLRQAWPGFGGTTITTKQIAKNRTSDISSILIEAENHMKKWVTEKK
jgi:protein-arginine kinase activator protein McsA